MKSGPIIIVEDDVDDQEFVREALDAIQVKNEVRFFADGKQALEFLLATLLKPLLIISDVNLPIMDGLNLKTAIEKNEVLRRKSIPFIFLSTSADPQAVLDAYDLNVQGFFVKENSFPGIQIQLKLIVDYWLACKHPLAFDAV